MPLQNRVNPNGGIEAVKSRGSFLGNRGIIHNEQKEIISPFKIKGWVTCQLEFKGRKRELMAKGRYTELFFIDEATAFSAGHRPCAECRRTRYNEFKSKWLEANQNLLIDDSRSIANIDKIIHQDRINKKQKVTYQDKMTLLPNGTMIQIDNIEYLIWNYKVFKWTFEGYESTNINIIDKNVTVLTPKSYVEMFKKGFIPTVHISLQEES
ncbi:MAG: hypothetical protein CL624_07470 [Arcobacter sp.]|nr:hypothetical protein [Arcobacter sp.]|tara:strand:- start:766 stop:1395 length:630 start_codon:yes stop_codon:yes gene_type:complete